MSEPNGKHFIMGSGLHQVQLTAVHDWEWSRTANPYTFQGPDFKATYLSQSFKGLDAGTTIHLAYGAENHPDYKLVMHSIRCGYYLQGRTCG